MSMIHGMHTWQTQKADPHDLPGRELLPCSKAMWIGFGFKGDFGVFTKRIYLRYSVVAFLQCSAIVPEIQKTFKAIETKKVKAKSPNPLRMIYANTK